MVKVASYIFYTLALLAVIFFESFSNVGIIEDLSNSGEILNNSFQVLYLL